MLMRPAWAVRKFIWSVTWAFIVVMRLWPRRVRVPASDNQIGLIPAPVAGLAGPYAFNPMIYEETREIFATASEEPERAQPVRLVRRHAPPMLLAHGTVDRRVLPLNSLRLAEALADAGNDAVARLYRRQGHVGVLLALADPFRRLFRVLDDTVGFLGHVLGRTAA
jgi:acetyl esterase/lipase